MKPHLQTPVWKRKPTILRSKRWSLPNWAWALIGAAISTLLLNGVTILTNVRSLPAEFVLTWNATKSLIYRDKAWTGRWSSSIEGYEDNPLVSGDEITLFLQNEFGVLTGEIFFDSMCKELLPLTPLLVTGKVTPILGRVYVTARTRYQGEWRALGTYEAAREDVGEGIIDLSLVDGPSPVLPQNFKLQFRKEADQSSMNQKISCTDEEFKSYYQSIVSRSKSWQGLLEP